MSVELHNFCPPVIPPLHLAIDSKRSFQTHPTSNFAADPMYTSLTIIVNLFRSLVPDVKMLYGLQVVLFESGQAGTSIVLRTSAPLLITEVLSCVWCEKACKIVRFLASKSSSWLLTDVLCIFAAALHFRLVVRLWELFFLAGHFRHRTI